jgi:chromosome partitioning protein
MKGVSVVINKGGTGKTITAINLADALAIKGKRILLIDIDPQGHATEAVGMADAYEREPHLGEFLLDRPAVEGRTISEIAVRRDPFWLIPSHPALFYTKQSLLSKPDGFMALRRRLKEIKSEFDAVIVDSPPELGMLSDNAIIACSQIIAPIFTSESSLRGLETTISRQLNPIREKLGLQIDILCILPNMVMNTGEKKRIVAGLRTAFGDKIAECEIRKRVDFDKAWREGKTLREFNPRSDQLICYEKLADKVLESEDLRFGD